MEDRILLTCHNILGQWYTKLHVPQRHSKPRLECSIAQQRRRRYGNDILRFKLNVFEGNDKDNYLIQRRLPNCAPRRFRALRDISECFFSCNLCILYFKMANTLLGHTVIKLFWPNYLIKGSVRWLFWPKGAVKNCWATNGAVNLILWTAAINKQKIQHF